MHQFVVLRHLRVPTNVTPVMIWFICAFFIFVQPAKSDDELICNSIEITSAQDLSLLSRCTIIAGHVSITNIELPRNSGIDLDFSTPIKEITDYLLIYRVHGLSSLQQIFPRLIIVRGQELLFGRYALTVYENRDILDLGLVSLLRIQRGSIRIESNPVLCFLETLNWLDLLGNSTRQHFSLKKNQSPNYCPLCKVENKAESNEHCWNLHNHQGRPKKNFYNQCRTICDSSECMSSIGCCKVSCLGGCSEANCSLCANYKSGTKCVESCKFPYYVYNKRECVSAEVCRNYSLIPFAGVCTPHCPTHYRVVYDEHDFPSCSLLCSGTYIIHTSQDLPPLKDCTSIQGSLIIELKELKSNIIDELGDYLGNLKEISGFLKITKSPQLVSLNFLHNLDTIGGNELIANKYALYVVGNYHLEQIWGNNQNVAVIKGRVYFHLNPRLCHDKIIQLQPSLKDVAKVTIEDASPNSNGERVICGKDVRTLNATLEDFNSTAALIKVDPMSIDDLNVLLGYLYHYKEAPERNITMYDRRHGCGHDNWLLDIAPNQNVRHIISNLRPHTQYAYFVKTLTRTDYHMQVDAYSQIQYFKTSPSKPGPVTKIYHRSISTTEIVVHWWPPKSPNGQIEKYLISYEMATLQPRNSTKMAKNYLIRTTPLITRDRCQCNAYNPQFSGSTPEDEKYYNKEMVTYDEALPNLIYVPRTDQPPIRQIRELDSLNDSEKLLKRSTGPRQFSESPSKQIRKRSTVEDNISLPENDDDANGWRLYHNYRMEMERKALLKQDTGRDDFPIVKPMPICNASDPTAQDQLKHGCRTQEYYTGISLPAHQHSYTLQHLAPQQTYRISIRACVSDLLNGCGSESAILAETASKRIETFLQEFRLHN